MLSPVPVDLPGVILGGWSKDEGSVPGASLQASLTESSQCPCEGSVYHPLYRSRNELREEVLSGPISLDSPILQAGFRTLTLPLSWLKGFLTQGSAPTHSLKTQGVMKQGLPSVPPGHLFPSPCLSFPICEMASPHAWLPLSALALSGHRQVSRLLPRLVPLSLVVWGRWEGAPPSPLPSMPGSCGRRSSSSPGAPGGRVCPERGAQALPAQEEGASGWFRQQVWEGWDPGQKAARSQADARKPFPAQAVVLCATCCPAVSGCVTQDESPSAFELL